MPYIKPRPAFTDGTGDPRTLTQSLVREPVAPDTELPGEPATVRYVPTGQANEQYRASVVGGPSGRVRPEINVDSAGWVAGPVAAGPAGVEQVVELRPVGLVHATHDIRTVVVEMEVEASSAGDLLG